MFKELEKEFMFKYEGSILLDLVVLKPNEFKMFKELFESELHFEILRPHPDHQFSSVAKLVIESENFEEIEAYVKKWYGENEVVHIKGIENAPKESEMQFVGTCIDYSNSKEPKISQLLDDACSKNLRLNIELRNPGALITCKGMSVPLDYQVTVYGEGEVFKSFVEDWFGKEAFESVN